MEPMEIDRKELKRIARQRMKLTEPKFWLVTLVYFLMTTLLVNALDLFPLAGEGDGFSTTLIFVTILTTLYTMVVDFGYTLWSLWTFRQLDPGMNSLMQGFSVVGRVVMLNMSIYVRTIGWTMLLYFAIIVPLAFLLPALLPAVDSLALESLSLLMVPILLFFYAALWVIMLRYSLAPYLLADRPDDGFDAAIRRSVELMRGWKWELFKLEFSFIGWETISFLLTVAVTVVFLLSSGFFAQIPGSDLAHLYGTFSSVANSAVCILVCNLVSLPLLLWLHPYREVTRAGFYDARLRLHHAGAPTPPPV